jgi:AbrB family looped-hinge helix DNA binding protein
MTKIVNINERGTLTLPREARERLGLSQAGQLVLEDTPEGILLRPGVTFPVEIYTPDRLAAFDAGEADLEPHVPALRAALEKAKARKASPTAQK